MLIELLIIETFLYLFNGTLLENSELVWTIHNLVFPKWIRRISQILLKCSVFRPSTWNWAENVLNVII